MPSRRRTSIALAPMTALLLLPLIAGPASAHATAHAGPYSLEIGWLAEPAYAGSLNAVQVEVRDAAGATVDDLFPGDLMVVVSAAGQDSDPFPLMPDEAGEAATPATGAYLAPLIPTLPGDYTFHLTGSIDGVVVDVTVTSGDGSFDPVIGSDAIEFPVRLPSGSEVATRLDRVDARVAEAASRSDTDRAMLVGGLLGGAGLVAGVAALVVAIRRRQGAA